MAFTPQNFVDQQGPAIKSAWLNPLDVTVNSVLAGAQTVAAAQAALGLPAGGVSLPLAITSGGTGANSAATAQQAIGGLVNILTAAETAASVTPANYLYQTLNVIRYGADPTGVADSTAAVNAALSVAKNATSGVGGIVFFPPGIYKISSNISIGDSQNIYIQGSGVNSTTINCTGAMTCAFVFGISGTANQGISQLTIECTNASGNCNGISVTSVANFYLDRVNFTTPYEGIVVNNGVIQYYSNFSMSAVKNAGIILAGSGNDQYFVNGVISNVGFTPPTTAGINLTGNLAAWFVNVDCVETTIGMLINPGTGSTVEWLFAMNCALGDTGSANGIEIAPTGSGIVNGLQFTQCWTCTNSNYGVYITASGTSSVNGVRFTSHRSLNNGYSGYVITTTTATLTNIFFNDCDASGNSITTPGTYSGFDIGAGVSGFGIQNCRSGQQDGLGATQARGIIVNPGSSNNYCIQNNDVRGNTTAISDNGTGTTKIVTGNLGYNPVGQTAVTVTASPFTYGNTTGAPMLLQVTGGTVSQIVVGNATWSSTNQSIFLPPGLAVVITYSAAPTVVYYGV